MKVLGVIVSALAGVAWLGALVVWLWPLTVSDDGLDWGFTFLWLFPLGLIVGAAVGARIALWLPKLPKVVRYLFPVPFLLAAVYAFHVQSRNMHVLNARLFASTQTNDVQGAADSLGHGADVNVRDASGLTPLMLALNKGDCKMVGYLLAWDPNFDRQNAEKARSVCGPNSPDLINLPG